MYVCCIIDNYCNKTILFYSIPYPLFHFKLINLICKNLSLIDSSVYAITDVIHNFSMSFSCLHIHQVWVLNVVYILTLFLDSSSQYHSLCKHLIIYKWKERSLHGLPDHKIYLYTKTTWKSTSPQRIKW